MHLHQLGHRDEFTVREFDTTITTVLPEGGTYSITQYRIVQFKNTVLQLLINEDDHNRE